MKKGDLSKFIEEAVRWRVFQRTIQDIKARNADADPDEMQRIIDEAVSEVRAERSRQKRRLTKPDARGARYQHPGFRPDGPGGKPRRHLSRLAGGKIHAPDLRGASRRAARHAAKAAVAERIKPYKAGRLVNQMKKLAEDIGPLPRVERSPDPTDDFLLALSEAGKADYLVTGDKSGLLALDRHKGTRIVSAREFAALFA